jgi:DNA-binding NarL/FixJ family response regulator
LTEALRLFTGFGDKRAQARTLLQIGLLEEMSGDDRAAVSGFEASLALYREIDQGHGIAHALVNLGDAAFRLGELDRSAVWTDEALAISRQFADPFLVSMALSNAGQLALRRIDAAAASAWYRETLVVSAEMEHQLGIADGLAGMAGVALLIRHPETAARLLGAAASLGESVGVHLLPHHGQFNDALAETQERLGEERFRVFWDEGHALTLAQATEEALSIESPAMPKPGKDALPFGLTQRELDVLHLIVAGLPDKQIADTLFMSPRTAQKHAATIFAKLGVSSRTAAAALAIRSGITSNE